jgi:DNA modification methylase
MFEEEKLNIDADDTVKRKSSGPPNRMNDLVYRDWMKFQKSFFRPITVEELYLENINFFTKQYTQNNTLTNVLLISGASDLKDLSSSRNVIYKAGISNRQQLLAELTSIPSKHYEFILIDFNVWGDADINSLISEYAAEFSQAIRNALVEQKYCCFLLTQSKSDIRCWEFSNNLRQHLKLRDEKICIDKNDAVLNCLILQSNDDERRPEHITPVTRAKGDFSYPAWIIPKPKPRQKNEILHPAKFPEPLIEEFIKIFTNVGANVFDPMSGTGSTIIAALSTNRNGYGTELMDEFATIAKNRISHMQSSASLFDVPENRPKAILVHANALDILVIDDFKSLVIDYCVTSPPYWSMLSNKGSENQKKRRDQNLKLTYSDDNEHDFGNIAGYDDFVDSLVVLYDRIADKMKSGAILTIIVKNVKRDQVVYPLAWDLVFKLCKTDSKFAFLGNTFWCQDDIGLKPFAVGIHWVSNTLHQYCLHLQKK